MRGLAREVRVRSETGWLAGLNWELTAIDEATLMCTGC